MKTFVYHITAISFSIILNSTIQAHTIDRKHLTLSNNEQALSHFFISFFKEKQNFDSNRLIALNKNEIKGFEILEHATNPPYFSDIKNADAIRKAYAESNMKTKQSDYETAQKSFKDKGYANARLGKSDFAYKSEFKNYKEALNDLNKLQKELKKANDELIAATKAYDHTQAAIDIFKFVDPEGFDKINSLTYTDKHGVTNKLIIIVSSSYLRSTLKKGVTLFRINPTTGIIRDNAINIILDMNSPAESDILAHELGHCITIARDPLVYYQSYLTLGDINYYDCQNPGSEGNYITIEAQKMQIDFNARIKKIIAVRKGSIYLAMKNSVNEKNLKRVVIP